MRERKGGGLFTHREAQVWIFFPDDDDDSHLFMTPTTRVAANFEQSESEQLHHISD